jgi:hypothetical protein
MTVVTKLWSNQQAMSFQCASQSFNNNDSNNNLNNKWIAILKSDVVDGWEIQEKCDG